MEIDLINKCRVCLGDSKEKNYMFSEFDQGVTLRDILVNTTGFEIEKDDVFSPYICQNCTSIIVEFYNLKTIYEENENQIKALLAESEATADTATTSDDVDDNTDQPDPPEQSSKQKKPESEDYITIKIESFNSDAEEDSVDDSDSRQDTETEVEPKEEYEYQEINTFTCPECGECFLKKEDIETHLVSKHDISEVDYDEITEISLLRVLKHQAVKCKICNEPFGSIEAYNKHMETHRMKNVCDICGIGFIKKSYLKDHQEIHCTEKRHICSYCNKAFKRRTVLVKHKRIHTHPRQCICEICGKAFNDKGTLKTHIMLLHLKERNYMCLICGIKFPLKGTLEKHIRRHQNKEREFFCTQCPLGYRDKSSLDRHIYVKHTSKSVKPTCSDCGKQYTTVSNLFKHQRNCHGIPIPPIPEQPIKQPAEEDSLE